MSKNEGTHISGGTINNSGPMIIGGKDNKIIINPSDSAGTDELTHAFENLVESIKLEIKNEEERKEILGLLKTLAEEINKEEPNKIVGKSLLSNLATTIGDIASVTEALLIFSTLAQKALGL